MAVCFALALLCLVVPSNADDSVAGGATPGCAAATQRALQSLDSTLPVTTPVAEGCSTLPRERCCLHHDGRDLYKIRGQPCVPALLGYKFTEGTEGRDACFTLGDSAVSKDSEHCEFIASNEEVALLPRGFTCESQGLQRLTESECKEAIDNLRVLPGHGLRFIHSDIPFRSIQSDWTAAGCMWLRIESSPAVLDLFYNQKSTTLEANLMMEYVCKTSPTSTSSKKGSSDTSKNTKKAR